MNFNQTLHFLRQFGLNSSEVGSIFPSTRYLGRVLSKYIKASDSPKRVLEVGPGIGTLTEQILLRLKPGDTLVLVEANGKFCEILKTLAQTDWKERLAGVNFSVCCCYLSELDKTEPFDFIVSGLPLNNFSYEVVRGILKDYRTLLKPDGILSYFEYMYARDFRQAQSRLTRNRHRLKTNVLLSRFIRLNEFEHEEVFLNFPPAVARYFRFDCKEK